MRWTSWGGGGGEHEHDERRCERHDDLGAEANVSEEQTDDKAVDVAGNSALDEAVEASQGEGEEGTEEVGHDVDWQAWGKGFEGYDVKALERGVMRVLRGGNNASGQGGGRASGSTCYCAVGGSAEDALDEGGNRHLRLR